VEAEQLKSMVTNTLFWMGVATVLLSNCAADRARAKYRLVHRGGASDETYACVT
jgi:3-ketoacyl-CoA synthase